MGMPTHHRDRSVRVQIITSANIGEFCAPVNVAKGGQQITLSRVAYYVFSSAASRKVLQSSLENQVVCDQPITIEPAAAARDAGLRYVADHMPGIRRKRAGRAFSYQNAKGEKVTDPATLDRI